MNDEKSIKLIFGIFPTKVASQTDTVGISKFLDGNMGIVKSFCGFFTYRPNFGIGILGGKLEHA